MRRGKKYSKSEILEGIKQAWDRGDDLRFNAVSDGPNRWMERSCHHYFKDWNEALEACGLTKQIVRARVYDKRREEKERQLLLDLAAAHRQGIDLSASVIQAKGNPNRGLYDRTKMHFKGRFAWHNALTAAGLPVDQIVRQGLWDRPKIIRHLQERHQQGQSLNCGAIKDDDPPLHKAIVNHFDSHDAALRAAGFKPEKIRRQTPRTKTEIVLKAIEAHLHGADLNPGKIKKSKKYRVYYWAAEKQFTLGWKEALTTAGIDWTQYFLRKHDYWNKERVIARIKELSEAGEPINAGYTDEYFNDLAHAGCRVFGSWNESLRAAGFDPEQIRLSCLSLTKEEVVARIKALSQTDQDLSTTAMSDAEDIEIRRLYCQGRARFGTWENAIAASGLHYATICKSVRHNATQMIEAVQDLQRQAISLRAGDIQNNLPWRWLYKAARRRYDSWGEFLEAAGIDSSIWCSITDWEEGKGVAKYLKENYPTGIVTGACHRDRNFAAAVSKYYDTIEEAVKAAELIYSRYGRISRGQLDNPLTVGILYRCNAKFLAELAEQIFARSREKVRRVIDKGDLQSDVFSLMLELLPEKPPATGLHEFCSQQIPKVLNRKYAEMFRETTFGNEVYLDIFRTDGDIWD